MKLPRVIARSLVLSLLFCSVLLSTAHAASTDIVPRGSSLYDAFSSLAKDGLLPDYGASDFLWERQYSRAQLAQILVNGLLGESSMLNDNGRLAQAEDGAQTEPALRDVLITLRPELEADGVDVDVLLAHMSVKPAAINALIAPEGRFGEQNSKSQSGSMLIYRGTLLGDLGNNSRYVISASNQSEDWRRVFDNEIGPRDQAGVTEAYIEWQGYHGLLFDIGRMFDYWGQGYRGATLLSDNAPPIDQARLWFPFSLGARFGRNWDFTQMAGGIEENGQQRYIEARRIEINFNRHWNADFQEAFKSTRSEWLLATPMPFYLFKGITLASTDVHSNYNFNLGLNYTTGPGFSAYSQLFVDDIKSPFRGRFLGFSVGKGGTTPQKIAYLVGMSGQTRTGTGLTVEFDASNPTTYAYQNTDAEWTNGPLEYLGLSDGPDSQEIFGRLSQRLTSKVTLALTYRNRWRQDNSFVEPTASDAAAYALFRIDNRNAVTLTYNDYSQNPFPFQPGSSGYPGGNGFTPISEGNPGQHLRIHELDAAYQFVF